jgi:hypothetical protein
MNLLYLGIRLTIGVEMLLDLELLFNTQLRKKAYSLVNFLYCQRDKPRPR